MIDSPSVIIKKLEYPPEIIEELNRANSFQLLRLSRSCLSDGNRDKAMLCMSGLQEYEVIYLLGNTSKIEGYCHNCYNKREESDSINPSDYFVMVRKH